MGINDYFEDRLFRTSEKNICIKHFEDKAIKYFIKSNYEDGYCDYCQKNLKVVSFNDLLDFMMAGIQNFYTDAANFMSYNSREGGYLGQTYMVHELINEEIGLETDPYDVSEDIIDAIDDIAWARPEMYYDTEGDTLKYAWDYFKNVIKHKSRYLFQDQIHFQNDEYHAFKILRAVGKLIHSLNLIKKVNAGTLIFRCRIHGPEESIIEPEFLVAPKEDYALYPNRFSPSGISMLYSAFDPQTAILETLNKNAASADIITLATFKTKRDIYTVDLTNLPEYPSIFNLKKIKKMHSIGFIYQLVRDLTKGISKDGKEHTEYVPTQVFTEYIKYALNKKRKNKIEGIVYPSSKNQKKEASVIFWDNPTCLENLELSNIETKTVEEFRQFNQ